MIVLPGIGTIVNVLAVILGSAIGLLIKKGIPQRFQESLMKAMSVSVIFIGIGSTLSEMLTINDDGSISLYGIMMLIVSMALGTFIGELLRIEDRLEALGNRLMKLKIFSGNAKFTEGFVSSTLMICIGAMAIIGSINDGMLKDPTLLYSKSIIDGVSTMILASSLGIGVLCSAIPMGIYQGLITLAAVIIGDFISPVVLTNLSLVGSVLIFCIGVNLLLGKKVKVGNMIPCLIIAAIYSLVIK